MMASLQTTTYLIISSTGRVRFTKNPPGLKANEVAMQLRVVLPYSLFERPLIHATVSVDPESVRPREISPEIIINTAQLIEQQTGCKVELSVMPPLHDRGAISLIRKAILAQQEEGKGCSFDALIAYCASYDLSGGRVGPLLDRMVEVGEVYSPKEGYFKLTIVEGPSESGGE